MVIQNRLKGSSHRQAHKPRKEPAADGSGNEAGACPDSILIKPQALGKQLLCRKDEIYLTQKESSEGCRVPAAKQRAGTGG